MAVEIVMPRLGMVMSEGTVTQWTKHRGDTVESGEVVAVVETEKITYELEATAGGILHPVVSEGTTVAVDGLLGYLLAEGESPPALPSPRSAESPMAEPPAAAPRTADGAAATGRSDQPTPSTPGARKLASRLGIDLARVPATGPRGRITEADVQGFAHTAPSPTQAAPLSGLPEPATSMRLSRMRRSIGEHMRGSLASSAQLSFFLEVDVTEAQRLRREISAEKQVRLTLADVLVKACVHALARAPTLNSRLVDGVIHQFDAVNMGIAVALDDGLAVPVVEGVEAMDIFTLAAATRDVVNRAREGKLRMHELAGGTFTISVLGIVDGFTPILNAGQTAILGVGRSVQKPVVKDGEVVAREMSTLSLTVDHQVVDGTGAAGFMRRLQQAIERPKQLFEDP